MALTSKVIFLNFKTQISLYFVLILDLIVKFEIFNEDINESSEANEVSESRDDPHIGTCYLGPYPTWTLFNNISYQCICQHPEAWKEEEAKALLCYQNQRHLHQRKWLREAKRM